MNKNEVAAINLAAVRNQVGKLFAGKKACVVGPARDGYEVWAVVECTQCGQRQNMTVRKLGDLLKYPNEAQLWNCPQPNCKSMNAAPAGEPKNKSIDEMSADEYRRQIVEPEFAARTRRSSAPSVDLHRQYNGVYRAAQKTDKESSIVSYEQYVALSPADRAKWDDWARSVNGKMAADYNRVRKGFESVGMTTDPRFPKTLQDFATLSDADRAALLQAADRCLP